MFRLKRGLCVGPLCMYTHMYTYIRCELWVPKHT